jgi:hypothetical protein
MIKTPADKVLVICDHCGCPIIGGRAGPLQLYRATRPLGSANPCRR